MSYKTENGVVLLNPAERSRKYSIEIKHKRALTNDGHRKYDENGNPMRLSKEQLAYRAGYLASCSDSQKAYRAKHPRYKRKTTNK